MSEGSEWPLPGLRTKLAEYRRARDECERLEQTEPRLIVTMVHGTWARNATWIEADSPFGDLLRYRLAPARVVPFRWSGGNSVRQRARAADALRAHTVAVREQFPNAKHAFVAHSHGGNVVLSALDTESLAAGTLGVATLGTPFLSASLRDRESLFGPADGMVAAMFAGIAVFAVGAALGHGRGWWLPGLATFAVVALVLVAASYAASAMKRHARRVSAMMPPTKLMPSQVTIVRTSADEAAAALSGARVAGGFAAIFWSMMTSRLVETLRDMLAAVDYFGFRKLERELTSQITKRSFDVRELRPNDAATVRQPAPGSSAAFSVYGRPDLLPFRPPVVVAEQPNTTSRMIRENLQTYGPLLVLTLLDDTRSWARWVGVVLAVGYGLPALGALLVSIASVPFGVLFALGRLPCGWTLPLAGPYLDLTAEPAPPGTWSVTQLHTDAEGELSHGRSHDDSEAITVVADWLHNRLVAAESSPPASV